MPDEPTFEANVQIGTRFRFIDRNGTATIDGAQLVLRRENGDVIAEAPLTEVWADKARGSGGGAARIRIGDDRYTIEPLRVLRANPLVLSGEAVNLGGDVKRLQKGRELTQAFLSVVEAEGGHLGKP